jgi:two-component system CheB/CheR fusion protein
MVVGIGASAGGLEPLEHFFGSLVPDTGMAYVVVQHLSPDYPSLMAELLAKHTAMPIHRVEDGMRVESDQVYLIPARKNMVIKDGVLRLTEQIRNEVAPPYPIDIFLDSLAEECGKNAVGIILSGTGTDGSRGVRSIKQSGGLVIVQDKFSAKFSGMPQTAVESGSVDVELSPTEMPDYLRAYAKDPTKLPLPHARMDEEAGRELTHVQKVLKLLNEQHGIDFEVYKPSTVHRRIDRRIMLSPEEDIDAYLKRLHEDPDELNRLYKDMLIGVTQFFRDPQAYDSLKSRVLLPMVESRDPNEEIRVWVAGCATGEEAYSIAMMLDEIRMQLGRPEQQIRIFATDAHRTSIEIASAGRYEADRLREVMPERLSKYFVSQGGEFQVAPVLRQMVTFAPQNLIKDVPFTRMDLVTCRNVLIYFKPPAQSQIISLLHFALRPHGTMFLGPSETTHPFGDEFETVDLHWRIYRKRRDVRLVPHAEMPVSTPTIKRRDYSPALIKPASRLPMADSRLLRAYDALLADVIDNAVLIDSRREVIHVFGGATDLLKQPSGRRSSDLLMMLSEKVKPAVGAVIQKARSENQEATLGAVRIDDGNSLIVTAKPLEDAFGLDGHILVKFDTVKPQQLTPEQQAARESNITFDTEGVSEERIASLEEELQYTKESLQSTIEELETTNEELNATNEELIASNEELQSTNEELHSVNEELHTVNAEYQQKITELTQLTDDMNNLLSSTEIGTLFIDHEMRIRRYTPAMEGLIKIREGDVGRPLDEIRTMFDYPEIIEDARDVLANGKDHKHEVRTEDDRYYLIRMNPYTVFSGVIAGVVITFVEITDLRLTELRLEESEERFQRAADDSPIMMWMSDQDGHNIWSSGAFLEFIGQDQETTTGEGWLHAVHPEDRDAMIKAWMETSAKQERWDYEFRTRRHDNAYRILYTSAQPRWGPAGEFLGYIGINTDMTDLRRAERDLKSITERFEAFMEYSPVIKWATDDAERFVFVNQAFERVMHVSSEDAIGQQPKHLFKDTMPQQVLERIHNADENAVETGQPQHLEIEVELFGEKFTFFVTRFVFYDATGKKYLGGSAVDMTELKRYERELKEINSQLEDRINQRTAELLDTRDQLETRVEERTHELSRNNQQLAARNMELDQFAHAASHDLSSPLRTIQGFAEHLRDSLDAGETGEAVDALNRIESAASRMSQLIESLLLFATVGREEFDSERVDLNHLLSQIRADLETEITNSGIHIDVEHKLPVVIGDPAMLRQVMQNLLGNAVKYHGSEAPRVVINASEEAGQHVITVKDNGIGFPSEDIERVFEPFQRVHTGRKRRGTGIGLSICKRVIERHGGKIWASSEPGKGSTFTFSLPAKPQKDSK